jgi:hypothetical protein
VYWVTLGSFHSCWLPWELGALGQVLERKEDWSEALEPKTSTHGPRVAAAELDKAIF